MVGRKSNFLPSPLHAFIIPEERTGYILLKMILNVLGHEMKCKYCDKKG
jgi:hypothetical protein